MHRSDNDFIICWGYCPLQSNGMLWICESESNNTWVTIIQRMTHAFEWAFDKSNVCGRIQMQMLKVRIQMHLQFHVDIWMHIQMHLHLLTSVISTRRRGWSLSAMIRGVLDGSAHLDGWFGLVLLAHADGWFGSLHWKLCHYWFQRHSIWPTLVAEF